MELIFEWDAKKANANLRKHKVSFDEAKTIFADERLLTFADDVRSEDEVRFISIGMSASARILLAVHTEIVRLPEQVVVRIISCRRATRKEINRYEKSE